MIAALAFACAGCGQQATSGSSAPNAAATLGSRPAPAGDRAGRRCRRNRGGGREQRPVIGERRKLDRLGRRAPAADIAHGDQAGALQSGFNADPDQATLTPNLLAIAPVDAPPQVQAIVNAGNEIAHLPYIWGGGHMTYEDSGYDCSGSISFVLAAAGLLKGTETAAQLMSYGDSGARASGSRSTRRKATRSCTSPGCDSTRSRSRETGSRWSNRSAADGGTFVARHPAGL